MIEIIPNWHPVFVHFTVALFSTSVIFYFFSYFFTKFKFLPKITFEIEIVARWCLWITTVLVIGTVLAGLQAYNTVQHDTPSHFAMTDHRNWAFVTAGMIILLGLWSIWRAYKKLVITIFFLIPLLFVQGLLLITAWKGAELVFRYGLGVMSLPKSEIQGHSHGVDDMKKHLHPTSKEMNIHKHSHNE